MQVSVGDTLAEEGRGVATGVVETRADDETTDVGAGVSEDDVAELSNAELEDSTTTDDDTALELDVTSLETEGKTRLMVGRTTSLVEEAETSPTVEEVTSLEVKDAVMVSTVSVVDDEDSKMGVDDADTWTVDVVTSTGVELAMSDDSAGSSVLVGVTSELGVIIDSTSLIVGVTSDKDSVLARTSSLADGVVSEELVVMTDGVVISELAGVGVESTSLDEEITSELDVGEGRTSVGVTVDEIVISVETSTDGETTSETVLVVEEELSITGVDASGDVIVTVSVEETASGVAVMVDEGVSVKIVSDGVESSEEDEEEISGVTIADEEAISEVTTEDEAMIGEEEASDETTADDTITSEDATGIEDTTTTEEDTAGVGEALDEGKEALLDLVGETEDEVDDLTELDAERVEEDVRPVVKRVDIVLVEEDLEEELLVDVVRVKELRADVDRVEDDLTEDERAEEDRTELVVGLTELEEERTADEERVEVWSVDTIAEERALGQVPKSDLQPVPQCAVVDPHQPYSEQQSPKPDPAQV